MAQRLTGGNEALSRYMLTMAPAIETKMEELGFNEGCRTCFSAQLIAVRLLIEEHKAQQALRSEAKVEPDEIVGDPGDVDETTVDQVIATIAGEIRRGRTHAQAARRIAGIGRVVASNCQGFEPAGLSEVTEHLPAERLVCPFAFVADQVGLPGPGDY